MSSVGSYLRDLRQRRGQSLEDLSRATRVSSRYIAALEADDLLELPSPVFTRGYIRAYCQVLGEPPDEALGLYERQSGVPGTAPTPTSGAEVTPEGVHRGGGTVLVSFVLLVVLGLALFVVTLALQSGRERQQAPTAADGPADGHTAAVADEVAPGPAERAVVPFAAAPPPPAPVPLPPSEHRAMRPNPAVVPSPSEIYAALGVVTSPYQLVARVSEPTWIRVRMEGGQATEETIAAGQTRVWVSNTPFVLTIGNAGGVALELNGRPLPPLGAPGTVINRLVIPPPER